MVDYVAAFDKMVIESDESKKTLEESLGNWLKVFKFPAIERGSYDRLECTSKHQIYPILGGKVVGDVNGDKTGIDFDGDPGEIALKAAIEAHDMVVRGRENGMTDEELIAAFKAKYYTDEQALYQPEAAFDLNASYMIPMLLRES